MERRDLYGAPAPAHKKIGVCCARKIDVLRTCALTLRRGHLTNVRYRQEVYPGLLIEITECKLNTIDNNLLV